MPRRLEVVHVVGARPNFMKIAPITKAMARHPDRFEQMLVHTGQHYDEEMSGFFFDDLNLPQPDVYLDVGPGTHAQQTARVMLAFEPVLLQQQPDLVLVVGDVNSTLACALVARKLHIKVGHVEAGLRSFDRHMPEEINRVLTDQIANLLFTTERDANDNLRREGISNERIYLVGNVMIDTLFRHKEQALALDTLKAFDLEPRSYALLTLHRPSNVDVPQVLSGILDALKEIQNRVPILFPAHPRTRERLAQFDLEERLVEMPNLQVTEPLGYLAFLNLMANARLVLTDSGGIQENTERPVTVTEGTNQIVGNDRERIVSETLKTLNRETRVGRAPELWDGKAAERIIETLLSMR
jgi:UDP-N-acetylglucosamine 2-epimerase (non-hydrolysing)